MADGSGQFDAHEHEAPVAGYANELPRGHNNCPIH